MTEYVTLKLPVYYRSKFNELNKKHDLGYSSFPELVRELLRKRYREIEDTGRKKTET